MSLRTSPRPFASGLVALVAAGGLLLSGTPAVATDETPDSSSSTQWSPTTPALKPYPKDDPRQFYRDYYNAVLPSEHLNVGERMFSDLIETYVFAVQDDGNAVLRGRDGQIRFSTGTSNVGPGESQENLLLMQSDGNLVVYSADNRVLWASGTDGEPGAHLVLGEEGDLVLYRENGTSAWSASAGKIAEPPHDTLDTGSTLSFGHQLTSADGRFRAVLQRDGNLVGYGPGGVVWSTATGGLRSRFTVQDDGNAVIYGADGSVKWASGTRGTGVHAVLDDSGVLALLDEDDAILWTSQAELPGSSLYAPNTLEIDDLLRSDDGAYRAVMQADGNFVVYGPKGAIWQSATAGVESSFEFSTDGGARVVAGNGAVTWSAKPAAGGAAPFHFVMQNDGNLVEYDGQHRAVWSTR